MKCNIVFLLVFTIFVLPGVGTTAAQLEVTPSSGEESSLPPGTLLENSPPEGFKGSDQREVDLGPSNQFVIPESTVGFDEQKVLRDPLCDSTNRPTILAITPDEARPGDTLVVTGSHFGAKSKCLYSVTFGEIPAEDFTLLEDNVFEVKVPKGLTTGIVFLNVVTNGGSARSAVLIKG